MVTETESNDTIATAQFLNLGLDAGEQSVLTVTGSLTVNVPGPDSLPLYVNGHGSIGTAFDNTFTNWTGRFSVEIGADNPIFGADTEFIKFLGLPGSVISVSAEATARFDPLVIIYDSEGNILAFNDNDPRHATYSSFLEFVIPARGDYYVSVQHYDTFQSDPFDPDSAVSLAGQDDTALANVIISNSVHDFDFYSFELEQGQVFAAAIDGLGTDLQLYDPAGRLVELSDENRSSSFATGSPLPGDEESDATLTALALTGGTYTLRASGSSTTDYTLEAGVFRRGDITEPIIDSSAFLVNTETNVSQSNPHVATQPDGSFSAVWRDNNGFFSDQLDYSIRFQAFNSNNQKVGPEVILFDVDDSLYDSATNTVYMFYPVMSQFDLVALTNGTYLFTYAVTPVAFGQEGVFGRIVDSTGASLSSEDFLMSPIGSVGDILEDISIVPLEDGGFLHSWNGGAGVGWQGQFFDASGTKISDPIQFDDEASGNPRVTLLSDGNLLLTHYEVVNDQREIVLRGQVYDQTGAPVGAETDLSSYDRFSSGSFKPYDLTVLANGNLVAIWHDYSLPNLTTVDFAFRVFDSDMVAVTDVVPIDNGFGINSNESRLVPLDDGGFAVLYSYGNSGTSFGTLKVEIYNYDGSPRGDTLLVSDTVYDPNSNFFSRISFDETADGKILVAWTDIGGELGDTSYLASHAQIIDPGVGPGHYVGSYGNNTVYGQQFDDLLEGGKGNDWLDGRLGDDRQFGGEGNDVIVYDAADDFQFVQGGEGFDTLFFYGSKVDVDLAANGFERTQLYTTDTANEDWNTRVDTFDADDRAVDSYTTFDDGTAQYSYFDTYNTRPWSELRQTFDAAGNMTDQVLFADPNSDLVYDGSSNFIPGTDGGETINGTSSGDSIYAFGGNDIVNGNANHDWLDGGLGSDRMFGGAGHDTIVFDAADDLQFVDGGDGFDILFFYETWQDIDLAAHNFEVSQLHRVDTGSEDWTSITETFDSDDLIYDRYTTFDDGSATYQIFDSHNAQAWTELRQTFDTSGNLIDQIFI